MPENQAKGDVFLKVLDQVVKKWGNRGLKEIDADPKNYKMEQWYPFSELTVILNNIKSKLGNNNPLSVYQLGFRIIKDDPRWQGIFDDQDPAEIFLSSERWARKRFPGLCYWNELPRGGHFAALEQPDTFVSELRGCFRRMR